MTQGNPAIAFSMRAVRAPSPPVHSVRLTGTFSDTIYDAQAHTLACSIESWTLNGTHESTKVSQTSSTDMRRSEREGGPNWRPSALLEHRDWPCLRAVMASSTFPGSHGPGDGKRGEGRDLRLSPLSEG